TNIPLSTTGIDMISLTKVGKTTVSSGIAIPAVLKTIWDLKVFVMPLIVVPLLSAIVSLLPALKSTTMSIIESIKNND
ncbi:MAG: hypothetical protein ACRCTJ_00175, partial [Brevinema sp.]